MKQRLPDEVLEAMLRRAHRVGDSLTKDEIRTLVQELRRLRRVSGEFLDATYRVTAAESKDRKREDDWETAHKELLVLLGRLP